MQLHRCGPIAAGNEKEIILAHALIEEESLEHFGIGIKEQFLDQCLAAAFGTGDSLSESELVDLVDQDVIDRPTHRTGDLDIDRQPDQIRPEEVVDEFDGVSLRRVLVRNELQPHRVKRGEPLRLRDGLTDRRRDVRVIENGEHLVLEKLAHVFFHELQELFAVQGFESS